jgi:hypothetical protein
MARVDHLTSGIYAPEKRISFNQFLIDDEEPTLIHTMSAQPLLRCSIPHGSAM